MRGGLEFTENTPASLRSFPPPYPASAQTAVLNVGGQQISAFAVAPLGANRGDDQTLLVNGQVSLTNDVASAEWIVARHGADVTPDAMKQNLNADLDSMFAMRTELATGVAAQQAAHAGQDIVLAPGNLANLNAAADPEGVFRYGAGTSAGTAQITIQYTNAEAIKRINLLNASKFLTGTKVAVGEDVSRVAGTESRSLRNADLAGSTSFSNAGQLLVQLTAASVAIADPATHVAVFTQAQVGLIKLMVINDALATTMVRYNADVGQAHDKNLQRFFPKSRRDAYSTAVAGAAVSAATMLLLHAEINRTAATDAQLVYNAADAGALRIVEAMAENQASGAPMTVPAMGTMYAAQVAILSNTAPTPRDPTFAQHHLTKLAIKDLILGPNGGFLAARIATASTAYTDTSLVGVDTGHWHGGAGYAPGVAGTVIGTSRGFTPVAGAAAGGGAVYEFREREISAEQPSWRGLVSGRSDLMKAVNELFTAS